MLDGQQVEDYFSSRLYLKRYASYAVHKVGPFAHYCAEGEALGFQPVEYFNPRWWKATHNLDNGEFSTAFENYLNHHQKTFPSEEYEIIRKSCFRSDDEFEEVARTNGRSRNGLCDFGLITKQNSKNATAPDQICLYLRLAGEGALVSPCRFFDPQFYLSENEDVVAAGVDPFVHYVRYGIFENRKPNSFLRGRRDLSTVTDKVRFLQEVFSPADLFEIDGSYEVDRWDVSFLGRGAKAHIPTNLFFGEPRINDTADYRPMLAVYRAYIEAKK